MSSKTITKEQLERIQLNMDEMYSMIERSGDEEMRQTFLENMEEESEQ